MYMYIIHVQCAVSNNAYVYMYDVFHGQIQTDLGIIKLFIINDSQPEALSYCL